MDFSDELIHWYLKNKRNLPWRNTKDAYVIWLSEIILQQTRVEQGLPYFHRFIDKYPDVNSFAAADEGDILNLRQRLFPLLPLTKQKRWLMVMFSGCWRGISGSVSLLTAPKGKKYSGILL